MIWYYDIKYLVNIHNITYITLLKFHVTAIFREIVVVKWNFKLYLLEFLYPLNIWKPPKGHTSFEVFLSRLESQMFLGDTSQYTESNFSDEEWKAL